MMFEVVLDGDASRVELELRQQRSHRHRAVEFVAFAVESDRHCNQTRLGGVEQVRILAYVSVLLGFRQVKVSSDGFG